MKSLKRILTLTKVFKILFKIAFICSIVGVSLGGTCFVGILIVGKKNLLEIFKDINFDASYNQALCSTLSFVAYASFSIALYYKFYKYCENILKIGTPFDKQVVLKTKKTAILSLVLSIVCSIVISIICSCFKVKDNFTHTLSLGYALFYLIIYFLLDYGADINAKNIPDESISEEKYEE
ncbi:MAG TPA: hypothetical protein DDY82_01965 [Clostridiales bacterium]|nr:hypothetical protein [Clostridiales bacterium]HBJ97822.1 hypothetical protein [Clostridiales bacterium]